MTHYMNPVSLLIGSFEETEQASQLLVQQFFCRLNHATPSAQHACFCRSCTAIKQHQHQQVVFISPERSYTIDDIEIIFERTRLIVDEGQAQFFILYNAQWLTDATANKLLKILEEPPAQNYFILNSDNQEAVIATIQSRSVVTRVHQASDASTAHHTLLDYFFTAYDPIGFEQELKTLQLSDNQSTELAQLLLARVYEQLQQGNLLNDPNNLTPLEYLLEQLHYPPQSGSSELFWKNLYLSFPR